MQPRGRWNIEKKNLKLKQNRFECKISGFMQKSVMNEMSTMSDQTITTFSQKLALADATEQT